MGKMMVTADEVLLKETPRDLFVYAYALFTHFSISYFFIHRLHLLPVFASLYLKPPVFRISTRTLFFLTSVITTSVSD
ncbi:uncharacterized protein LACBIDRAFT_309404 [Laccaria bicolor S238N-H82]|uniref:Predicted protein n=1 Tax=Laccaria bicolor (strain S238N-H82 / ATCC MYA-4686) TaxID=486041 RepID=B0DS83_LACBS|nr:uncharacterized protein LACBIDRAFT_309404 [Laccaria bicolor S238N-H82]EDR02427.1 predicted protein [Laccaria bicolor S238N-H82]|eukprot:XP_001886790.1 predicted protein [Laccaria bicolor S238N-H82]